MLRRWLACSAVMAGIAGTLTFASLERARAEPRAQLEYLADKLRRPGFLQGGAGGRVEHARAQWDFAATHGAACRKALEASGAKLRALPDRSAPDRAGCGMPHGVMLTRGPTGITYAPPLVVDCSLAQALPGIERIVQEEAQRWLGAPIQKISTLGSYSCRSVRGWKERLSQHALGNAMDLAGFQPERGRAAVVARHYARGGAEATTPEGRFLAAVSGRLWSEVDITRVLGPDWDASHRDHFHLDRGLRWW